MRQSVTQGSNEVMTILHKLAPIRNARIPVMTSRRVCNDSTQSSRIQATGFLFTRPYLAHANMFPEPSTVISLYTDRASLFRADPAIAVLVLGRPRGSEGAATEEKGLATATSGQDTNHSCNIRS